MLMSSSKTLQMERQKQQDEDWQRLEQERQQALEAKEEAERELEERKQQQSKQLATVKAKLDRLKAQKQDMVEKLKQVPSTGITWPHSACSHGTAPKGA